MQPEPAFELHAKYYTRGPAQYMVVVVVVIVVVVVRTLSRIIKSVVTEQAPVTLELRNTQGKKHKQTKGGCTGILYHS